ncbi:MAG: CCA tRNA nucleotidyltransferase [Thermogutta sp.]
MPVDPKQQRLFAIEVVSRLREAGYTAYWAGGCVRDELLGRPPVDYDVATDALPDEVREIFGRRRTYAVGAAFGVITVLGPRGAGHVEVATFRSDVSYSDGRRPDAVRFSSPEEDALRRDFTINGLFYDPLSQKVIDFVNGLEDLRAGIIRAIRDPRVRFAEDYLRMLRAVRFVAQLQFQLDAGTLDAIREMPERITSVSRERIAAELEKLLTAPGRAEAAQLLHESGLLAHVLPPLANLATANTARWRRNLAVLGRLPRPSVSSALAALAEVALAPDEARQLAKRLRFSNAQAEELAWLLEHGRVLDEAPCRPWSEIQPILTSPWAEDLLALAEARAEVDGRPKNSLDWCREKRLLPPEVLHPAPWIRGDDLIRYALPAGPAYRQILQEAWRSQLDGKLRSREQALAWLDEAVSRMGRDAAARSKNHGDARKRRPARGGEVAHVSDGDCRHRPPGDADSRSDARSDPRTEVLTKALTDAQTKARTEMSTETSTDARTEARTEPRDNAAPPPPSNGEQAASRRPSPG